MQHCEKAHEADSSVVLTCAQPRTSRNHLPESFTRTKQLQGVLGDKNNLSPTPLAKVNSCETSQITLTSPWNVTSSDRTAMTNGAALGIAESWDNKVKMVFIVSKLGSDMHRMNQQLPNQRLPNKWLTRGANLCNIFDDESTRSQAKIPERETCQSRSCCPTDALTLPWTNDGETKKPGKPKS